MTRARAASGDEYLRKANYTAERYKNPPALAIDGDGRDAILVNKTTIIFYAAIFNTIFAFEVSKKLVTKVLKFGLELLLLVNLETFLRQNVC